MCFSGDNSVNMKRILCLLMGILLLLGLAACGSSEKTKETQPAANNSATEPISEVDNPVAFFTVSYSPTEEEYNYLTAYTNEDGTAYVEYCGDSQKVATMDVSVLNIITVALQNSGLLSFDGVTECVEGDAMGSLSVGYANDTYASAEYGGVVPEEFIDGYRFLEECFRTLMADIPDM